MNLAVHTCIGQSNCCAGDALHSNYFVCVPALLHTLAQAVRSLTVVILISDLQNEHAGLNQRVIVQVSACRKHQHIRQQIIY